MSPRTKKLAAVTALVACMLGVLAAAAWAWDRSHADEIADGVEIGGVDVGGLTASQARDRLESALIDPLREPVVVRHEERTFKLGPGRLGIRADIAATVERALAVSRDGGLVARMVRRITGGELDRRIRPRVAFDQDEVESFVSEVAGELDVEPQDASVSPTASSLSVVPEADGFATDTELLGERIEAAVMSRDGRERRVSAPVERVEPSVTQDSLAASHPVYLTADRANFQLHLWENLELAKTYRIAVGAAGHDTPSGLYSIQNKQVDPAWHVPDSDWAGDLAGEVIPPGAPNNPLKARWLGVYNGVGVHGTDDIGSLGSAASKGCLRMDVPDVVELYERVPVGTPIFIG